MMKKNVLVWAICLFLLFAISLSVGAQEVNLRFGHIYAPDHPYSNAARELAERVSEKTDGDFTIDVYPAGQLGSEKDLLDSIVAGVIDLAYVGPGELGKRFSKVSVFDAPFIFENYEHGNKVVNGELGQEILAEMQEETGIKSLANMYYGTRKLTLNTPIETPEDLEGMKVRAPDMPLPVATVRGMGANPTPMAFSEVYLALQQGVVDGQENPIPTIYSQKFYEVQDYIIHTNHTVAFTPMIITEDKFNDLPEEYQTILQETAQEVMKIEHKEALKYEEDRLAEMKEAGIKEIYPELQAFRESSQSIVKEFQDDWGEGTYEKLQSAN
jgi:tripartite ATP-independent transporter DctP family solute receptor